MSERDGAYAFFALFVGIYSCGGFYSKRQFMKLGFTKKEFYIAKRKLEERELIKHVGRNRFELTEKGEAIMKWLITGYAKTFPEKFRALSESIPASY